MSALQAIPTEHGIDILNSELKSTVTKYQLIGAVTHDADSDNLHPFHNDQIETSFYDENGVLTFIVNLPIDTHFNEYLYKINVLDSDDKIVIECDTPKVALAKGIGGIVTLKAAISGQAGDVVFKHGEYLTEAELDVLLLSKYVQTSNAQFLPYDPNRIYTVGEICYTKDSDTNELTYWQWYSNVESLAGKNPLNLANRHDAWEDNTKPFYWIPYTGDQVGMPFFWLDTTAPEWAVMEINADLPIAVYWRLARRYPDLVNGNTINTGEIRGEYLRVLDQGRGADPERIINTWQNSTAFMGDGDGQNASIANLNDESHRRILGFEFDAPGDTRESIYVKYGEFSNGLTTPGATGVGQANTTSDFARTRVRNIARPMAISI